MNLLGKQKIAGETDASRLFGIDYTDTMSRAIGASIPHGGYLGPGMGAAFGGALMRAGRGQPIDAERALIETGGGAAGVLGAQHLAGGRRMGGIVPMVGAAVGSQVIGQVYDRLRRARELTRTA